MKTARLEQLSDGIFAIVMTLIVFQLKVPALPAPVNESDLLLAIQNLFPFLASFVLSFALLFTYWRAHHFFISVYAKNINNELTNINAVFFMLIALVPFSASLLGEYSANELPIIIFGIHVILIGFCLLWMRNYVLYSPEIKNPEVTTHEIHGSTVRTLVPIVFSFIAILISFFSRELALTLFTLAILFNLSSSSTRIFGKTIRTLHITSSENI